MTSFIWAMVGSLAFILAYGYYTVAGVFPLPGSGAIVLLIEFGTCMGTLILLAVLAGTCLMRPTDAAVPPEEIDP